MSDLASYLQGKLKGLGDDMRRKAGQSNAANMRESLPMLLLGLNAIGSRAGAVLGNDSVTAARLFNTTPINPRTGWPDPGITGGRRLWGEPNPDGQPAWMGGSAADLTSRHYNNIRSLNDPHTLARVRSGQEDPVSIFLGRQPPAEVRSQFRVVPGGKTD